MLAEKDELLVESQLEQLAVSLVRREREGGREGGKGYSAEKKMMYK